MGTLRGSPPTLTSYLGMVVDSVVRCGVHNGVIEELDSQDRVWVRWFDEDDGWSEVTERLDVRRLILLEPPSVRDRVWASYCAWRLTQ